MKRRWLLVVAVMIFVAFGAVFTINVRAKYIESKSLKVTVAVGKRYYVHFDANEGTGDMDDQEFSYGEEHTLTANTFTRDGFNFVGWNRVADGGTEGDFYTDEEAVANLTDIGEEIVVLYAQWEEEAMHTEFEMDGVCVFHGYDIQQGTGDGHITGDNCIVNGIDWADGTHKYIDTGVKLYSEENYSKDYEIGFTIVEYDSDHQFHNLDVDGDTATQTTFMNTKLEDSSRHWPGLVVRKNTDKIEITQTIKKGNTYERKAESHSAATTTKVVVARVDGVIYYSFNDEPFSVLQDMNGTSDFFDVNVWFGAAERADGAPMRYLDATLTNLYIKVGDTGANKYTVSFDARGVTDDPQDVAVVKNSKIGNALPTMGNYNGYYFGGWYTQEDGEGILVTRDYVVEQDMTLYAYWRDNNDVCRVGNETRNTLQECINIAGPSETITLQKDIEEQVSIISGKEITIDLGGHILSDSNTAGQPVIENNGKITIINGTITSSLRAGVINNNSGAELYIKNDARIIATGIRQAIYNYGGELEISDNAYLSAVSSERGTVQNELAGGKITIKGGTIIATKQQGVNNKAGTLIIGELGGGIHSDTPVIRGATYGVTTATDITIYDGILKGKTAAIDDVGRITTIEPGANRVEDTEIIEGSTYQRLYYQ